VWYYYDVPPLCSDAIPYSRAFFGQGEGNVLLEDLECTGSEMRLVDCPSYKNFRDCGHEEDAGVRCTGKSTLYNDFILHKPVKSHVINLVSISTRVLYPVILLPLVITYIGVLVGLCSDGDLRLRGGNTSSEGRLEICYNKIWGTICNTIWNQINAAVACLQLGFSSMGEF